MPLAQDGRGGVRAAPPQVVGRAQRGLAILDPQVDRRRGLADDDQPVIRANAVEALGQTVGAEGGTIVVRVRVGTPLTLLMWIALSAILTVSYEL